MLPGIMLFVYIPWAVVHSVTTGGTQTILYYVLLVGVGGTVTITVVIIVTIIARRSILTEMKKQEDARIADDLAKETTEAIL